MGFSNLVSRFVLAAVAVVPAAAAHAAPRLQLHPLEVLGYAGKALRLSVELPCGGYYYGLVAKDAGKGRLELAAAIRTEAIACTSLPDPIELRVDYLDTTGFQTIAAMKVREGAVRLAVARVEDLRRVAATKASRGAKATKAGIEAVYGTRCGEEVGAVIRHVGERELEMGLVERSPQGGSLCASKPEHKLVTVLDPTAVYDVKPLRERSGPLRRAFYLRMAEVKPESIQRTGASGVKLTYKRACDEAPVGIVVGDADRKSVRIGMLVARYYNHICENEAAEWADASEADLALGAGLTLVAAPATEDLATVGLSAPIGVAKVEKASTEGVSIAYLQGCSQPLGAVYARDARGKLAVGVVMAAGAGQCKSRPAEVSLYQPYLARTVGDHELFPLRLSGSPSA